MARTAELKFRATMDGAQAEAGIKRLQNSIDRLGDTVGGKIKSAFLSVFSAEKILQMAKAMDRLLVDTSKWVDKLKSGKTTIDEITKETKLSAENVGFAGEYGRARNQMSGPIQNAAVWGMRGLVGGIGLMPSGTGATIRNLMEGIAPGSANRLIASAVTPNAPQLARDEAAGIDAANAESERQATIRYIQRMESDEPQPYWGDWRKKQEEANAPSAPNRLHENLSRFQRMGAYAGEADRSIQIQTNQLRSLHRIERILQASRDRSLVPTTGVQFPSS